MLSTKTVYVNMDLTYIFEGNVVSMMCVVDMSECLLSPTMTPCRLRLHRRALTVQWIWKVSHSCCLPHTAYVQSPAGKSGKSHRIWFVRESQGISKMSQKKVGGNENLSRTLFNNCYFIFCNTFYAVVVCLPVCVCVCVCVCVRHTPVLYQNS